MIELSQIDWTHFSAQNQSVPFQNIPNPNGPLEYFYQTKVHQQSVIHIFPSGTILNFAKGVW